MIDNNFSSLGIKSSQLDRTFTTGASMWWMPTTQGVRPEGRLRRLGAAREGRDALRLLHDVEPRATLHERRRRALPKTPRIRLADSVNVFDPGALAPDVTVNTVNYRILAFDAGHEVPRHLPADRVLQPLARQLRGGRPLPVTQHPRHRLLRAGRFLPVPKKLELYGGPHRSSATRTPGSATAANTWRAELLRRRIHEITG